jgi:Uma2 family endonuclease
MMEWVKQRLTYPVIVEQAGAKWPGMAEAYVQASYRLVHRLCQLEQPPPIVLQRELYLVHRKRARQIHQVGAILKAGDAPVSMHTLYRGLLRDHEASCFKMLANDRQADQDRLRQQNAEQAKAAAPRTVNQSVGDALKNRAAPEEEDDDDDDDDDDDGFDDEEPVNPTPQRGKPAKGFRMFGWLIGFIGSMALVGAASASGYWFPEQMTFSSITKTEYDKDVSTSLTMSLAIEPPKPKRVPTAARQTKAVAKPAERMLLSNISWEQYGQLIDIFAEQHVYLTYDDGLMEMRMPLPENERAAEIINYLIAFLAHFLDIKIDALGSTTIRSSKVHKGLEPDKCFYLTNLELIRSKKRLDMAKDPPPDLAIEIEVTASLIPRIPIYADLGIPELWRYDGKKLTIEMLQSTGSYSVAKRSKAFPNISAIKLMEWISRGETLGHSSMLHAVEAWCKSKR